ncbi:MAG: hypothetical protein JKY37_29730, partial [Nannocystaceae bacterium]|nr:hypothetical protein [Nannocystaceae bacterium]
MEDALNSRSDLEVLKRSGRGKVVVVVVVLALCVLAGAAWSLMGPQGTGNPEELHKVIVVSSTSGRSIPLSNLGFDAAEGSLAAWVSKANSDVPDLQVEGTEAIMQLADRFGYAWVVFENPQDVDFSALDIEGGVPDFPESAKFVVLSSGDLAFPHTLTVNPKPSDVVRGPSTMVLQTLFAQPALAETLSDNESPSIAVIQLRDRLADAIERVERIGPAELMVETIAADVQQLLAESDRAEPSAKLVGESLEVTTPVPLPNGQILSIARGYSLVAHDAVRVDVDLDETERFLVGPVGAAPSERQGCEALAGGGLGGHEAGKYWYADDGSAILMKTLSDGMTLWTITASAEPCGFVSAGRVPAAEPGFGGGAPALAPGSSGRVARTGYVAGQGVVSVVSAGSRERAVLGMVDGVELSGPRWIGDRFIVVRASPVGSASGGLLILDIERPLLVLALPAALFGGADEIDEVAVGGTPQAPAVVVTAGSDLRRLYVWSPGPLVAMFD